jgi:hypothetical protein
MLSVFLLACQRERPQAKSVCDKLVAAGVATNCKDGGPADGLMAAAAERYVFDLPSVPDETGQVARFDKASDYDATVKAFDAMAALAGRHRYGSERALIFVQLNSKASAEIGAKAAAVVSSL